MNGNVSPVAFLTQSDLTSMAQRSKLLHNLQHHGWSPISIVVPRNRGEMELDSSHKNELEESSSYVLPPTKDAILQLMQSHQNDEQDSTKIAERFTFRIAESGAKGGTSIEPKESLELKRSNIVLHQDSTTLADEWCWAMSEIAKSISDLLELPPNSLLVSPSPSSASPPPKETPTTAPTTNGQQLHKRQQNDRNCLDLLRIFSYHATPTGRRLGSSPHTDWGSWTIVWQDDVGGLETYSRARQQWEPVPTTTTQHNDGGDDAIWNCIVHVGDMASLALQQGDYHGVAVTEMSGKDARPRSCCFWPSPEHRVLTSTTRKRTSLVYFGYPPADTSIYTLRQQLKDWKPFCRGSPLPLQEYYLLQNQSSTSANMGDEEEKDANAQSTQLQEFYDKLEHLSIQEVIQEKWNQVQRSD